MFKVRLATLLILLVSITAGAFVVNSELVYRDAQQTGEEPAGFGQFPFRLGLDLQGGTHLVYEADVSEIPQNAVAESMQSLRDVIERRVNLFGVTEPVVQVERTAGILSDEAERRLIVELPGVTDIEEATEMIGRTPFLEFKIEDANAPENPESPHERFKATDFTGRFLENARLEFGTGQGGVAANQPVILLEFTDEGTEAFAELTRNNVGKQFAVYLDGSSIIDTTGDGEITENDLYAPVIQEAITGGTAQITGSVNAEEARTIVSRLNAGALPVPISLLSSQSVGATLGSEAVSSGVFAGIVGVSAVALFMLAWYRLPGLIAIAALATYIAFMLAIFKLVPVTLTAAGIAGFILSIGMAVDANVIIFERMKEERRRGTTLRESVRIGFGRAWLAIRDSNISSIITAVILFWFGTSVVEGFALVFGLGVLLSMLTAITITRTLLLAVTKEESGNLLSFLYGSGISGQKEHAQHK